MNEKKKAELKMFLWYLIYEPWRKIKYALDKIENKILTPEFLSYFYFVFGAILLIKNWRDWRWIGATVILIIIWIRHLWKKKKFIHIYRKIKYKEDINHDTQQ